MISRPWSPGRRPTRRREIPRDLPAPPKFSDDWQLGTPDLVIDIGADFTVPASGDDIYRCFVVPTKLEKDQYVSAVGIPAGQPPGGPSHPGFRRRFW